MEISAQNIFKKIKGLVAITGAVDKEGLRTMRCRECGAKIEYNEYVKYCPGCSIFNFFRR